MKGCYKKLFCPCKKTTTENKWSFKEVAKRVIPPSVVSYSNTMLTYILGNHSNLWTQPTRSFLVLMISSSLFFFISDLRCYKIPS